MSEDGFDCGDNSCLFASKKGGMRTNGGCRCLKDINDPAQRRKVQHAILERRTLIAEVTALRAVAVAAQDAVDAWAAGNDSHKEMFDLRAALDAKDGGAP